MIPRPVDALKRRLSRVLRPGPRAVVLLYHRIADEASDPYGLCVPPAQFEQHLQAIGEIGQPTALSRLAATLAGGEVPDRAICVTFDDGYLDNLECATPLLERYGVPATIFVTTGDGGREREFWWDELERIFLRPGRLPGRLELSVAGRPHSWDLGPEGDYTPEDAARHPRWHVLETHAPSPRHAAFQAIYHLVQPLNEAERTRTMDALVAWAGRDPGEVRRSHRALEPEQAAHLAASGIVQIGAHTVRHPTLPAEAADAQQREIEGSRQQLEEWIGRPVPGFAYPYGMYDQSSIASVRRSGYSFACACTYQPVRQGSDPYLLPRIEVTAGDADRVAELLQWQLA